MKTKALLACVAVAAGTFAASPASAQQLPDQFIPTQNFDFTPGVSIVGQGDWLLRGTLADPPILVESGSLTYAPGGIPASTGNSIILQTIDGEDARLLFPNGAVTPADGNTYYWSAILEWDGTDVGDNNSTYIGSMLVSDGATTTFFRGILRVTADLGQVFLGTQLYASTNSLIGYAATPIVANQPVFVVVKVTEVPGTRNDTSELFLFTNTAVPATEPATASAEHTYSLAGTGSGDIAVSNSGFGATAIVFRQFLAATGTTPPTNWRVDEVRAGSTWTSVITGEASTADWMMY